MKTLYLLIIATVVGLMATSCSKPSPTETISTARTAISAGDYELAEKTLDDAVAILDSSNPSASQLCEMAVLYMIVGDQQTEAENAASALECYKRAVAISPDSVTAYFKTLPPEESQYLFLLSSLSQ